MATKLTKANGLGGMHTAGIFSDMTVDGPNIGTLVVIMDRAKNLPNRRSMGKQDPYCAARLGKEAKKTTTDKRGGQTPRWDQELRFTVHDSPDYHNLKVSVFNDDKKTELIGETYVSLESVLTPGGGQSDSWHGLNCKGKYAGEIRIELTYYDTRPKNEKAPVEKRKESARAEGASPAVGGPRENTPIKRRPLPSDPTGASPSPVHTPDHPRLAGPQSGPRGYPTPPPQPRGNEHTPTHQRRSYHPDAQSQRRPLPDAASMNGTPVSSRHTPQQQARSSRVEQDTYSPASNQPLSSGSASPYQPHGFDMSYTAPKAYEVQPTDSQSHHPSERSSRTMSMDPYADPQAHPHHIGLPHSHSAPIVPTQHTDGYSPRHQEQQFSNGPHAAEPYDERAYQVEPLRMSRSNDRSHDYPASHDAYQASNGYAEPQTSYDPFTSHSRSPGAMQPTVEDEDDIPPPPPVHRSNTAPMHQQLQAAPPGYHDDTPAPLNITRYREEPQHPEYDGAPHSYGMSEVAAHSASERRYTHPRVSPQGNSRPVSRDTVAPSPLRNETAMIPSSLVAGLNSSRQENRMSVRADYREPGAYQATSYDMPPQARHTVESDYRLPPQYETPPRQLQLTHHQSIPVAESPDYYPHSAPQEPRHTSPVHEPAPIIKPRAVSPGENQDARASRGALRSMPTRKSVSPRPPPPALESSERRLSGIPFAPDSFDVLNPTVSQKSGANGTTGDNRRSSNVEVNDKGQVVTFSGRVIDASDHLPLDSWAPEPEPKGPKKDRTARERPALSGARDLEAARQRERDYRNDRAERERIRNAVNTAHGGAGSPSNALVMSRHQYSSSHGSPGARAMILPEQTTTPPGSGGRNRLQKRDTRPMSTYTPSTNPSPGHIPMPHTHVLRERENLGGYGSSPSYGAGSRHSVAAPPIPAKIPLEGGASEDMAALSLELQSIDIGPGSGGRRRTARRNYGGY
ncbi:hypothetical protein K491DRAFT_427578 [Lophiostoma macrostomum CBS 122681]|uniref:C2 domain-containing protein n=1 Tax=Lophiostoma macrostomum CBS 122681 TaxID=1314788 RepID=A0A6A6T6Q6_9PLEO|nr:hypothetical protein K491DRAFT_427578 [Lophiostoma macrostomum CBS 122681]